MALTKKYLFADHATPSNILLLSSAVRPGHWRDGGTTIKFRNYVNWTGTHSIFRYFPAANKMSKKTFHSVSSHGRQPNPPGHSLSPILYSVTAQPHCS
jgi:hypothetical protein